LDYIWVTGENAGSGLNVTAAQISVGSSSGSFSYLTPGNTTLVTSCLNCAYISTAQSSPVPYEQPYAAAWEAFLAAANLHFKPDYTPQGTNLGPQLGYMRSGTWVGGESYVYCPVDLASLGSPYAYTVPKWLSDYQSKVNYVQSLSPTMVRYWPIDPDTTPDTMALDAISAANGHGFINGFGSQGLSARDSFLGCVSANADWCNLFSSNSYGYYSLGMPRELQQISISDETQSCSSAGACGPPPKTAGDLGQWLPFAVSHEATVFEMYYLDLALAFDSQYCPTQSGTPPACTSGYGIPSYLTTTQQATWCSHVGLCNASCPSSSACYAYKITQNHGPM
jgi:hypothetical protein